MKFKVVVPAYNAEQWIERCLDSIRTQEFYDFECLVIDDASKDGTCAVATKTLERFDDPRFRLIRRDYNIGPLANTWYGFVELGCRDEEEAIFTIVDGDDWLAHDRAFSIVEAAYSEDPELLMTYGNYANDSAPDVGRCSAFHPTTIAARSFRSEKQVCISCLRTFKAKLWKGLKAQDLYDPDTKNFFTAGGDAVYCLAALDMAGSRHKFIPDIIYYYNTSNPISDSKIRGLEQIRVDCLVRRYPTLPLLEDRE